MDGLSLIKTAKSLGAIAVPAHPGRRRIGIFDYDISDHVIEELEVLEVLNGASAATENDKAFTMIGSHSWGGIGGSDAHLTSAIGKCLTHFEFSVHDEESLVTQLRYGKYEAVALTRARDTKE